MGWKIQFKKSNIIRDEWSFIWVHANPFMLNVGIVISQRRRHRPTERNSKENKVNAKSFLLNKKEYCNWFQQQKHNSIPIKMMSHTYVFLMSCRLIMFSADLILNIELTIYVSEKVSSCIYSFLQHHNYLW